MTTIDDASAPRLGRPPGPTPKVRSAVDLATGEELAESGYASFSMERVAERAEVHRSTLYKHWPTKRDLVLAYARSTFADRVPSPDTGTWEGDLRAIFDEMARAIAEPTSIGLLRALAAAGHTDPELHEAVLNMWGRDSAQHIAPIERAQARGEVDPDLDPALVLEAISAPLIERLCVTGVAISPHFVEFSVQLILRGTRPD